MRKKCTADITRNSARAVRTHLLGRRLFALSLLLLLLLRAARLTRVVRAFAAEVILVEHLSRRRSQLDNHLLRSAITSRFDMREI